jgi:hypothetical protein
VIYVPSVIKFGSGIQKLIGGIHTDTHRQQRDLISLLYFFRIRKVDYKSDDRDMQCRNSQDSSVRIVTRLQTGRPMNQVSILGNGKKLFSSA